MVVYSQTHKWHYILTFIQSKYTSVSFQCLVNAFLISMCYFLNVCGIKCKPNLHYWLVKHGHVQHSTGNWRGRIDMYKHCIMHSMQVSIPCPTLVERNIGIPYTMHGKNDYHTTTLYHNPQFISTFIINSVNQMIPQTQWYEI